jgi:hypothetical protein
MLNPYEYHTEPETLLYYQENTLSTTWFMTTRRKLDDVVEEANAYFEPEGDDFDDEPVNIGVIYRLKDENNVLLYSAGEDSRLVGRIALEGDKISFYDADDKKLDTVPKTAHYESGHYYILTGYIQTIFDVDDFAY